MSKVFNMVGGGGGKNISSIVITGLSSTDTVTCTKDGKSYTATWDSTAQHWEIVGLPLGTFTVTATNGTKTITETVLIDITGVYEIEMDYFLWLYKYGDECEGVTGGWESIGLGINERYNTAVAPGIVRNANNLTLNQTTVSGSYNCGVVKTVNKIPLADAKYVHFSVVNATCAEAWAAVQGLVMKSIAGTVADSRSAYVNILENTTGPVSGIFTIDVRSITDDCYIGIDLYQESTVIVDRIWVE